MNEKQKEMLEYKDFDNTIPLFFKIIMAIMVAYATILGIFALKEYGIEITIPLLNIIILDAFVFFVLYLKLISFIIKCYEVSKD